MQLYSKHKVAATRLGFRERPQAARHVIMNDICRVFEIKASDIVCPSRKADHVFPRKLYCFVTYYLELGAFKDIGTDLGNRDHTTIMHAFNDMIDGLDVFDEKYVWYMKKYIEEGNENFTRYFTWIKFEKPARKEFTEFIKEKSRPKAEYTNLPSPLNIIYESETD